MVTPNRPADGERLSQFSEYLKSHASRKSMQEIDHSSSQKSSGSKLSERGLPLSQLGLRLWGSEERRGKCLRKRGHFTKMLSKESTSGYISEFIMNRTASSLHLSTSVVWRCRVEGEGSGVVEGEGCRVEGGGSGVVEGYPGEGCRVEGEGSGVVEGEGEGEGSGVVEGEGEGEGSGVVEGEGEGSGVVEGYPGEGCRVEGEGSGVVEGEGEGEGSGVVEGEGEGSGVVEGEGCRVEGGGSGVGQERNIVLLFSCPVSGSVYDLGAVSRRHSGSGEPTAWQSHITV